MYSRCRFGAVTCRVTDIVAFRKEYRPGARYFNQFRCTRYTSLSSVATIIVSFLRFVFMCKESWEMKIRGHVCLYMIREKYERQRVCRRKRISIQIVETTYFSGRQEIKYSIISGTIRQQRKRIRTSNNEAEKKLHTPSLYIQVDIRQKNIPVNGPTSVPARPIFQTNFQPKRNYREVWVGSIDFQHGVTSFRLLNDPERCPVP